MTRIETTFEHGVHAYSEQLAQFDREVAKQSSIDYALFTCLVAHTEHVLDACAEFERGHCRDDLREARQFFQTETAPWFLSSYFMRRARIWPRGYAGDFETLEGIYAGVPLSRQGMGLYLDSYFLTRRIVAAARGRLAKLVELLKEELQTRPTGARVFNIACGSCRELAAMPTEVIHAAPSVTCIDTDQQALDHAQNLLFCNDVPSANVRLVRHNAVRLTQRQRSIDRFGMQDIIYSMGLLDYLDDDTLVPILGTLYAMLAPGGRLIAPFKDARCYDVRDRHWLVNWDAFRQRTEEEIDALFHCAGIPDDCIRKSRERTGTMIFYEVRRCVPTEMMAGQRRGAHV